MRKITLYFLFFYFFLLPSNVLAQEELEVSATPFISNFAPEDYKADPQNWFLTQDQQGIMYVANTLGVLTYDGVAWEKISLPNIIARSVVTGTNGKVYVGSQGDFGYLAANSQGEMRYSSLSDKIPAEYKNFADVWSCFTTPTNTYFFSSTHLFCLKNEKITVIKAPKKFRFSFKTDDLLYIQDDSLGLVRIADQTLQTMPNAAFFLDKEIRSILPYQANSLLITTLKHGLWVYDKQTGNVKTLGDSNTNNFLINNLVFCGQKLQNNLFAIGTFRNGLVILNEEGEIVNLINEGAGLRNNSVRQLWLDAHGGLWLALNNGVSRIEIHSPFVIFDKKQGLRGSVNAICEYQQQTFVGTSLGVFRFVTHRKATLVEKFEQLKGFNDQAFNVTATPYGVLVASNTGSYLINQDASIQAISTTPSFVHLVSKLYPQRVFVGLRDGIEVWDYNTTTKKWTVLHNPFPNLHGEVRAIVQDEAGQIWVATKTNGIFRITLQDNLPKSAIKNYTTQQGLWSDKQNKVFSINTSICVGNAKGFVKYNPTKDVFEPHPQLKIDAKELTTQDFWQLAGDNEGNIWAWSQSAKGVFEQKKQYEWNKQLFSRIPQETIQQIFPSGNFVWVGTVNALYRYDKTYQQHHQQGFSVLLRKVSLIPQDSTIAGTYYDANTRTRLHFNNNSLSFDFAATYFDNPAANQYQYMLEGYEKEWSSWTNDTRKDYTNLWNGSYRLKIKAKNIYGELSNERTYHFEILPPWYRTYWAYALYVFAVVAFVILFIRVYTQRLQLQNQKLEELVKLRTAEIQQQKEEIETQRDNLEFLNQETASQKSEIEKSYQNIQVLSQIGTALTKIREVENIITTFYGSVNTLIDAPVFAVGLCNDQRNRLDFYSIENQSSPLEYSFDTLDNPNKLSIWCYRHNQPIYINNIEEEYNLYLEKLQLPETNIPYSIMYVPLRLNETVFGVVTVQSFQKNAYTDYQKTIFNNLANYISIALDNAQAYRTIAQKNQQITDSIRYAETIQKAILPTIAEMQSSFGENYFVFYQAKDVVSGDFYWLSNQQTNPQLPANTSFVAAVDCTGHGVPGAFMSLIGATLLNQIIEQKQILSPAKIIGALHTDIRKLLRQKDHANRDGMDVCLCKLEKQDHTTLLTFAGAKRSLLRVNLENNLEQIKGTYKAVGGGYKEHIDFEEITHQLQIGEMIYLTSDGYTDQNDLHNEKLSSVRLKNLLLSIAQLPIVEQYEQIKTTFLVHKGNETQRDDVTVLGIRIGA